MNDIERKLWAEMYVIQTDKNNSSSGYPGTYQIAEMVADQAVEALRVREADEIEGPNVRNVTVTCKNTSHGPYSHRQRKSCSKPIPNDKT
jgi:hypothetical protein